MSAKSYFYDIGRKTGITSAAALSAVPSYDTTDTNPIMFSTDTGRKATAVLLEVDIDGAGTGDVDITIWRGNPALQAVSIAHDEAVAGVWSTSYTGTAVRRSIIVDTMGLDVGVTASVGAANITANIHATAIF